MWYLVERETLRVSLFPLVRQAWRVARKRHLIGCGG